MVLDTMTLEELIREIKTDFSEVKGRWKNYVRKFRKTAQKRTMFPWLWEANIKTRRFNEWYISFYAESKKEVGILNPTFTMLFKYKGQLLVGAVTNDVVLIFTGHFFDRYKERFFKIHKDSRPVTNREIMKVFFLFNSNYCFYSKEKEENVRGYCYDGMLLGDWIGEEGGFVKTFISRQEMKMNQFVEYFEFFKMWIIEDMFKSRKGFELKNSLTEYIPDTYFEYGEWDKFLFERDNLRLIKAAEESQEIYMKNREEYRRCFQLIDAVNINMFLAVYAGRAYNAYTCVWNGGEWAMRAVSRESIRSNLPYVFHDHQLFTPEERSKIDCIFLTWSDVGSYARLAGEDVPVWNRYSIVNELSGQKDAYIDEIEAAMETGEGVYDMIPQGLETLEGYLEWMNEAGWYVHDMEYQETILQGVQSFTLAGLEMAHGRENCWYRTQKTFMDAQETEKEVPEWRWENASGDDHPTIRAVLCDPDYWMMKQPFEVEIIVSDGTNSRTAAVIQAGQKEYEPMEVQLDLTGLQGEIKLELVSTAETKRAVVINPEWSAKTVEE